MIRLPLYFSAFALLPALVFGGDQAPTSAFGISEKQDTALFGIFYDLKQSPQLERIPGRDQKYSETLDEFVAKGFDESVLNRFFRATRPLYANRIWMPRMDADEAPKAFGVGNIVAPSRWIVQYKGQISPPTPGTYRFLGYSDDVLVAALGGSIVLNANHPGTKMPMTGWAPKESPPRSSGAKGLVAGDWFTVREDEILDLDLIVGERPGGGFLAHLFVQKREASSDPKSADGMGPFRLTEEPTPGLKRMQDVPAWKAIP